MVRTVSVWHGKDGYTLHVTDEVAWWWLVGYAWGAVCKMSRGYLCPLCLCNHWEWTFKVGWGRDEDGLRTHSLGTLLFRLGQFDMHRGSRIVYERPLTFDEVCGHFPEARSEDDDDGVSYRRGVMIDPAVPLDEGPFTCTTDTKITTTSTVQDA